MPPSPTASAAAAADPNEDQGMSIDSVRMSPAVEHVSLNETNEGDDQGSNVVANHAPTSDPADHGILDGAKGDGKRPEVDYPPTSTPTHQDTVGEVDAATDEQSDMSLDTPVVSSPAERVPGVGEEVVPSRSPSTHETKITHGESMEVDPVPTAAQTDLHTHAREERFTSEESVAVAFNVQVEAGRASGALDVISVVCGFRCSLINRQRASRSPVNGSLGSLGSLVTVSSFINPPRS